VLYHLWANGKALRTRGSRLGLGRVIVFAVIVSLVVSIPLRGYDLAYHPYLGTAVLTKPIVTVNPATNQTVTTTTTTTATLPCPCPSYAKTELVTNPLENFLFYFTYQSTLKGCGQTNAWNCYPWNWILPFNVSPLVYYSTSVNVSSTISNGHLLNVVNHPIDWLGMGNLVVWYSIWLIVPVILWKLARRTAGAIDALVGSVIAGTYLPLFYVSLVVGRVEFAFYFINTDVGLALGIPMVIGFLARGRVKVEWLLIAVWLLAAIAFFFAYFPVNPFAFMS
jgi:hypothetical protein